MSQIYFNLGGGNLSQNWSNTGLITTDDDWANVPSFQGFLGQNITTATGTNPGTLTTDSAVAGDLDVIANQTTPNTVSTGGVAEFQIADPTIALNGSGTADAPHLVMYLNATGRENLVVSFSARDLDGSTDNAVQPIAVQYRVGETGAWTNLPPAGGAASDPQIADATTGPSLATLVTPISITLPSAVNNQAQVQVRFMTANAVGNDEWVGIDNISVTSDAAPQAVRFADDSLLVAKSEGDAGTTAFTFTVERLGTTDGNVDFTVSVSAAAANSANPVDFTGSPLLPFAVNGTILAGQSSATVTVNVNGDTSVEVNENFTLTITNVTNATAPVQIDADHDQAAGRILTDDFAGTDVGGVAVMAEAASLQGAAAAPVATNGVELVRLGSYAAAGGNAEVVSFDPSTDQLYILNATGSKVEIVQISSAGALTKTGEIDLASLTEFGSANSVAIKNGIVAVAYGNITVGNNGYVALFNAAGVLQGSPIQVGVLPDMVTFTPDGSKILVANEAEAVSTLSNANGTISIIDVSAGAASATVQTTVGFTALNGHETDLDGSLGLSLFPGQSASADIEPEYIAVAPDGTRAYVTLQEANAVAVIDLTDPAATSPLAILPLGSIDRSLAGNAFDPSDMDGIDIGNWAVRSLLQPDSIATFTIGGETYFVTANEGDARVGTGLTGEEVRLGNASYNLDDTVFPTEAALKDNANLGRLNVINHEGDTDGDGDIDVITTFGGRGISIFKQNADGSIEKVRETGGEFERILAQQPNANLFFNGEITFGSFDSRSDNKGPEPEGVDVGVINGRTYAFVVLERAGGVMIYDVTNPASATFVGYKPPLPPTVQPSPDNGPETVKFISAADSPTGTALVITANEVGNATTVYAAVTPIYQIQGSGHTSPLNGQSVSTMGVVTAVDSNGFYIQDPNGDGNPATSDGVFVFTTAAPTVAVGQSVMVTGTVNEFVPSGAAPGFLSVTEIAVQNSDVHVLGVGEAITPVEIGGAGHLAPPTSDISDGALFFEALEGMLVKVNNPVVVSPTNSNGEIFTVVDNDDNAANGLNATGLNNRGVLQLTPGTPEPDNPLNTRSEALRSLNTTGGDFNPERIQIDDDSGILAGFVSPAVNPGAHLQSVTGVLSYNFANYEVLATQAYGVAQASSLAKETTSLTGTANRLTVASYNAENLDHLDPAARFTTIASEVVSRLKSPDIIAMQEVQDNDGATGGTGSSTTAANLTLQDLVAAINAAEPAGSGVVYAFIDNPFIGDDTNGGEPGGNIRTAFLYRTDRVDLVDHSLRTIGVNGVAISDPASAAALDQRSNVDNPFYGSRPPLVATFAFNGNEVTIVNNHFTSKGGSGAVIGSIEPPLNASEVQRAAQAQAVNNLVDNLLASDPNTKVMVAGDLNEFPNEEPMSVLKGIATITNYDVPASNDPFDATATYTAGGTAVLHDLLETLPANEQYDYVFDGNAQTLDHVMVTGNLAASAQFDVVRINAEFHDQTSDHDPLAASFDLPTSAFTTGPSTTTAPYLVASQTNVTITSILTAGDSLGTRPDGVANHMVGIPDGLGAFDNGDGTFTVLMNHELPSTFGIAREHGAVGAFVDKLIIDKNTLAVQSAEDLIKHVFLYDPGTNTYGETATAFNRFCSGDLPAPAAFFNAISGRGTTDIIYMNGEETAEGRAFAHVVSGADAGNSYELARFGNLAFENSVANPFSGDKTVVMSMDDSTPGQVYVYIGDKQSTGNTIERAGLTDGQLYAIKVSTFLDEANSTTVAPNGVAFSLVALGDVSAKNAVQLQTDSEAAGATEFLRPEDGAWDPTHAGRFYFVTTNGITSPSRLWSLDFSNPSDYSQGGTIKMLLDGTEGQVMMDNLTVDGNGHVIIQEDPGNNARVARVWDYNPATDNLVEIAHHDTALFNTATTQDEESSGIIDVTSILGDATHNAYLLDVQAHSAPFKPAGALGTETVEGGQLAVMYVEHSNFTLQLLHLYGETGTIAKNTAPIMGAMIDKFDDQYANTLVLAEGDTWIPGPWLVAGADPSLNAVPGIGATALARPDVAIMNAFGVDASALGNHEFDLGSPVVSGAIAPSGAWVGAQFPFITANLDFSADASLRGLADASLGGTATNNFAGQEASSIKSKIAPSAVVTVGGEKIGIVGATTYDLLSKTSPNGTTPKDDGNPSTDDLQEVAAYVQAAVNALLAQGVNKIVMVDQLDTIERNKALAPMVSGIDIMVAGGGHERMGDANDVPGSFNGHSPTFVPDAYPIVTAGSDSKPTLIVTTDTEFTYLGRLVVEFDSNGELILGSLNNTIDGAYASNEATLKQVYGTTDTAEQIIDQSVIGSKVEAIADAIDAIVTVKDANKFGFSDVYLEGDRVFARAQETNLGDITADANAWKAQQALGEVPFLVSLKNGGGLRASVGSIDEDGSKIGNPVVPGAAGNVSQLDVENSLRFDNKLMVFDTTPQGLLNILNWGAGLSANNGGFPQIGGVKFSYDPDLPGNSGTSPNFTTGSRVRDVAIIDDEGNVIAVVADDGVVVADAPALIQVVTLNFTANGGDDYPVKANGDNFRFLLKDGTLSAPVSEALNFTAAGVVPANALGEQQALSDFMGAFHSSPATAYDQADTPAALDTRIQNLNVRDDAVFNSPAIAGTTGDDVLTGTAGIDTIDGLAGSDFLFGNALNDILTGGDGGDTVAGGAGNDKLAGGADIDTAAYTGSLVAANITVVADADPTTPGNQAGWQVDAGAEGTDLLVGLERISDGTGHSFLLAGSGSFPTVAVARAAAGPGDTVLIGAGAHALHDFSGDSNSDILWRNVANGGTSIWDMNDSQLAIPPSSLGSIDIHWKISAVGDFNGDGSSDILWHNTDNGITSIWEMNNGQLAAQPVSLGTINTDWQIAGVGDFNGDNNSDILWHNVASGGTSIWQMNNGQLAASPSFLGNINTDWQIAGVADFNGDSNSDILWHNVATGGTSIWQMNNGQLAASPSFLGNINTDWQIAGVGDFNGDSNRDILWHNVANGGTSIWEMNGGQLAALPIFLGNISTDWEISAVGDFSGDSNSDILWHNVANGGTSIWEMNGGQLAAPPPTFLGNISTDWHIVV